MGANSYVCRSHKERTGRRGGLFGPLPILNRLKGSLREKNNLKESQNKIIHVETLESAVRVKDKVLKNLKLSHDKFNEKVKERTFKLRPNAKSTDKLNEKVDRESEWKIKN